MGRGGGLIRWWGILILGRDSGLRISLKQASEGQWSLNKRNSWEDTIRRR